MLAAAGCDLDLGELDTSRDGDVVSEGGTSSVEGGAPAEDGGSDVPEGGRPVDGGGPFPRKDAASGPGDGAVDAAPQPDGGVLCCQAEAVCAQGEETFYSAEACQDAGGGCRTHSICCSTVWCRQSDCAGTLVEEKTDCVDAANDPYCYPLPSGRYCTGPRGSCPSYARPIGADVPCPKGHDCWDEADGQRCASRVLTAAQCEEVGDYATPAIGTLVPCDPGDIGIGMVSGFEPSMCCLDVNASTPGTCEGGCDDGFRCCPTCLDAGACVEETASCPDLECDACGAMDAEMVGGCEPAPLYRWDGEHCRPVTGCECQGSDCDQLFPSFEDCQAGMQQRGCAPLDCRITGCGPAQSCVSCWVEYVCVPKGFAC